jgi:hypothetical protein
MMPASCRHRVLGCALYLAILGQTADAQAGATAPSASYEVSGGLDDTAKKAAVDAMAAKGLTASFDGGTVTLSVNSDGTGSINQTLKYQGSYTDSSKNRYTRYIDYKLSVTKCELNLSSCTGTYTATSYRIYNTEDPWNLPGGTGTWNAQLQSDRTYLFTIPNGNPPTWGDIPYRLRPAGTDPSGTDKVTITSTTPPAGSRADPLFAMNSMKANVDYELSTADSGVL